jgi:hypothetical protein
MRWDSAWSVYPGNSTDSGPSHLARRPGDTRVKNVQSWPTPWNIIETILVELPVKQRKLIVNWIECNLFWLIDGWCSLSMAGSSFDTEKGCCERLGESLMDRLDVIMPYERLSPSFNKRYRGLARDVINDVTDGRRHVGGIFFAPHRTF